MGPKERHQNNTKQCKLHHNTSFANAASSAKAERTILNWALRPSKSRWGTAPLHSACFGNRQTEVVELLIENGGGGAVGEEECNSENSALHLSCDGKTSVGVIKLLIDSVGRGVFEWTNVDGEIALCV